MLLGFIEAPNRLITPFSLSLHKRVTTSFGVIPSWRAISLKGSVVKVMPFSMPAKSLWSISSIFLTLKACLGQLEMYVYLKATNCRQVKYIKVFHACFLLNLIQY